ncbi:hypothetical protein MRX96_030913 [Rhipicephalus microplus]
MIRARRETPFRFTGDLGSASCGWLTMAVHLNPCALATLVLLLLDKCTEGGHGEAFSAQPPKGKGEAALFSPHEDRTMPEKSNNGGSKDNDRWKVKAIPFPPVGGEEGHGLPGIPARRAVSSLGKQQSDFAAAHSRRME